MKITEFFDPYNMEHIKAYEEMLIHGFLPNGFAPEDIEYDNAWQVLIAFKMAGAWTEQVLTGNVVGMPPVEAVEPWTTDEWRYEADEG